MCVGLRDPADEPQGLAVLRTVDAAEMFEPFAFPGYPPAVRLIGMNMIYDGHLVVGGFGGIAVIDTDFRKPAAVYEFTPGELLSNSFSVDDRGGIYVATGSLAPRQPGTMRKLVWTGERISDDPAHGAWSAPYEGGDWAPAVKVGTGTGATPTLMGFDEGEDRLVVLTDGANRMSLVAFWRDDIPADFVQRPGTLSPRIADQIPVTAGLASDVDWIQSEQSVATCGWAAVVVNNVTSEGQADRLVDVMVSGPVTRPAYGVERLEWDRAEHRWRSVWTRPDLASISMVPVISTSSRITCINTYGELDGWEVTGLDLDSGETVHRSIFGPAQAGNGAYALVQILPAVTCCSTRSPDRSASRSARHDARTRSAERPEDRPPSAELPRRSRVELPRNCRPLQRSPTRMLGSLIPAAAGVALSPVPIIELILVLFSNRRGPNSVAFVVSLIALTAAAVALGVAGQQPTESSAGETSKGAAVGMLVLGLVLVAVGVKNWHNRAERSEPKVFAKIADMGPGAAAFLGLGATFLNQKNAVLLIAAGQTIGASTSGSKLIIGAAFVLIATLPYTAAVGYALLAGEHARTRLDAARAWLISHNRAIMGVLCAVLGALLVGKALASI
jgi:hypothetical protein